VRVDTIPTPGRPQLQFHHVSELGAAPALSVASPPQAGSAELGTGHPHTFPARVLYCRFIEPLTHKSLWRSNYERPAHPGCHPQLGNWNEPNIVDGFAPKRNVALWAAALKSAHFATNSVDSDPVVVIRRRMSRPVDSPVHRYSTPDVTLAGPYHTSR
jgi:hypothetical protein